MALQQIFMYIILIGFIFILSKNIVKPFGRQLSLRKDPDGLTIYNITPISFSYVIVVIIIALYAVHDFRSLNLITVAITFVFLILSISSGLVNSRIVMGHKQFSYMYSLMKFSEISKIIIKKSPKGNDRYLITINTTTGKVLTFSLPREKKDQFKTYMTTHGKNSMEKA